MYITIIIVNETLTYITYIRGECFFFAIMCLYRVREVSLTEDKKYI